MTFAERFEGTLANHGLPPKAADESQPVESTGHSQRGDGGDGAPKEPEPDPDMKP